MRFPILAMTSLLLVSCSCERKADTGTQAPAPLPADAGETSAQAGYVSPLDASAAMARSEAVRGAVSDVHAYIRAAAAKDWAKADAFWSGGKPPARPGDQVLRELEGLQTMRIVNQPPVHLDQQSPPDALEIPVELRIRDSGGNREITGWYRARRDGAQWKITSASLAPAID